MAIPRYCVLNTQAKMPTLGFGSYLLKGDPLRSALDYALFVGYRLIDTAYSYHNEADIGQVVKDRIKAGKLNRKDLFITTKIAKTHMRKADVATCFQKSLHDLQTSYVDSLLIHHPWSVVSVGPEGKQHFDNVDIVETWAGLQSLFREGSAKSIGVSNFTIDQLKRILSCNGPPLSHLQMECHAYLAQYKLKDFCDANNIVVTAYSPLGAPNVPTADANQKKHLLADPLINEIAKKVVKTPAQILLNFLMKRGMVVVPKSKNRDRLKENFKSRDWVLSTEDFNSILQLDCGVKYFKFSNRKGHQEYFPEADF
ncbi:Aldo/Keto reductase [Plakobranchus ocellatus]|uniref:Aldo/Keto reductase n=1 Tax=Plakobranchus ocellatus TaxID=259542 RepID=A0AAV3ZLH7_9GAST|nr:Aldo/Keto reductase [Plakobranchus ocellatus]